MPRYDTRRNKMATKRAGKGCLIGRDCQSMAVIEIGNKFVAGGEGMFPDPW
jgi:hypothetical protein